jgi:hypothetical protein
VRQRRPGRRASRAPLPLLEEDGLDAAVGHAVACRAILRDGVEETLEDVRAKESMLSELQADAAPLSRWKQIADLWCAGWFDSRARNVSRATFDALLDNVAGRYAALTDAVLDAVLRIGGDAAMAHRFFHWELEFPEIFHGPDGAALELPGFDAIIGNPPWEMLRGDSGDESTRQKAADAGSAVTRFARGSGCYRLQGGGHANLYQLFLERALGLVRRGGRLGLVLPSGFATDHGCAPLRAHVLRSTTVDTFAVVENRDGLFPIHRALKFVLMTVTSSPPQLTPGTATIVPLRSGVRSAAELEGMADTGTDTSDVRVSLQLIEQLSGDQLVIPELRTPLDARIAAHLSFGFPAARAEEGWGLRFGRELNATDDRRHLSGRRDGLPVIGGRHVRPFSVDLGAATDYIHPSAAERALGRRPFDRSRVAYRDVASSTNRLTLIAAVLPPGVVTTHTLFCLRTPLDEEAQHYVTGMFNSFVANYLVRLRVTTHVTVAIVERLPLPKPDRSVTDFGVVVRCAQALARRPEDPAAYAVLQGAAARLYRLDTVGFEHILGTFPLVDESIRRASLSAFTRGASP